jgi:uncharacterized protein YqgC (DUF456 family)
VNDEALQHGRLRGGNGYVGKVSQLRPPERRRPILLSKPAASQANWLVERCAVDVVTIALWTLAAALCLIGLAGLVLPALPGAPLLFLGILVAAWIDRFTYIGLGTLSVIMILMVLAMAADFAAGAFGARRFGASKRSVLGATIGAVVGIFFGIPGVLLGPFVGAVIGELTVRRDHAAAGRARIGATIGLALGTAAKLALGFAMVGIALVMRLWGN